jgi:hypothetical protein
MRLLVIAVWIAAGLGAAELKIDHATVAGMHLDEMRQALTAATGMPTEYGGPHSNHATEMALVSFPDGSYLELMGIQAKPDPAAVARHEWYSCLVSKSAPCAFALRVNDMVREVVALKSAGIEVSEPVTAGRTRPDGKKLEWQTVNIGHGVRGQSFPFLIADQTPREDRAYPSGKATTNDFRGIAQVVIGVRDLDGAIAQYERAFHLSPPMRQRDRRFGAMAWFQETPIVLAQGVGKRVAEYGEGPVAFLLANGKAGVSGSGSNWFGHSVMWIDESKLGWRLGILI